MSSFLPSCSIVGSVLCVSQVVIDRFSFSQSSLDTVYQLFEGSTMLYPSFSSWEHHTPRKSIVLNKDWLDTWMKECGTALCVHGFLLSLRHLHVCPSCLQVQTQSLHQQFPLYFCPEILPHLPSHTILWKLQKLCPQWQSSYLLLLRKPRQRSRWFPRPRSVRELRDPLINKARSFPIAFHLRMPTVLREWLTLDILKL